MNPIPETVVVLRFSALGDVLLTAPAIAALKRAWPKVRLVYAIKERLTHLVRHNPHVDEVIALRKGEGPLSFSRKLKACRPGAVLNLHNKIRSKLIRFLMPGISTTVWTKRDPWDTLPVKLGLRPYHSELPLADCFHRAVELLVGETLPKGELRYWLGPDDLRLADEQLAAAGVLPDVPFLGISPGANWETKRWPAEGFGKVARRALARGLQVVICGSADESGLGELICREAPGTFDLSGKLDLKALGGVIARSNAFLANDSGPMHMARALGVPTLAFFGSTDPKMFHFEGHGVLFAGVPCSPCSFFGRSSCPRGHFDCMRKLTDEMAWAALQPLLEGGRRRPLTG